ncbi:Transmembrane protein 50A, partial [Armadillidium vulgare]
FFGGWWIVIDAAAQYPSNDQFLHAYHTCGVMATLAMFMVNSVSNSQIAGEGMTDGCLGLMGSRVWFFLGLMLTFGSMIGACWILFGGFVIPKFLYDKRNIYVVREIDVCVKKLIISKMF